MIFSDNYDKFRTAQIAYNSELEKNPELMDLDLVTDFFGASLESLNIRFKRIFDYLTTVNTSSNKIENYASVSDTSLKGNTLINAITKNAGVDASFLTSQASVEISTIPNLNISYIVNGCSYNITSSNGVLRFSAVEQHANAVSTTEKVAYLVSINETPCVVVREKNTFKNLDGEREELTDFIIDSNTKTIKYMRGVTVNTSFVVPYSKVITTSSVVSVNNTPCFISQINGEKAMVQPLKQNPIFFKPEKTQIYLYDTDLCVDLNNSVSLDDAKQVSKQFGKIVLESSKSVGLTDVFALSNGANKGGKF